MEIRKNTEKRIKRADKETKGKLEADSAERELTQLRYQSWMEELTRQRTQKKWIRAMFPARWEKRIYDGDKICEEIRNLPSKINCNLFSGNFIRRMTVALN